jgi:hypothetical protein
MKLLKQPILNTKATKNNRKYSSDLIELIEQQINRREKSRNLGTLGYPEGLVVDLFQVAFVYSNAVVEGDVLYVDIETLNTSKGIELERILESENDICFRPGGSATLEGDMPDETHNLLNVPKHVSNDYQLITIAAITANEDALNF